MLAARHLRDLTLCTRSRAGHPLHLSAASGLVCVGRQVYVVADDELHPGRFSRGGNAVGELLPPFADFRHGALLALGSDSGPNRCSGALLALNEAGDIAAPIQPL